MIESNQIELLFFKWVKFCENVFSSVYLKKLFLKERYPSRRSRKIGLPIHRQARQIEKTNSGTQRKL